MLEVDAKLKAVIGSNNYYTFNIDRLSTQLVLSFQDNSKFGDLNDHTTKALEGLFRRPSIQLEVLGPTSTIRETISRATKAADAVVRVNINVYGSEDERKDVAQYLSHQKVYLQRPDFQRPGSIYDNPHVLKFPDVEIPSFEYQSEIATHRVETSNDKEGFQEIVNGVYASLTRGTKLSRMEGDSRVETQLLPYVINLLLVNRGVNHVPEPSSFSMRRSSFF
jgi:SWI/SNF-related matrix-associated actin-dependent regulator of chromatin subfamily A3